MLLAGGDLIASFGHPGVWAPNDVKIPVKKRKKTRYPYDVLTGFFFFCLVASHCRSLWLCHYRKNWYRCIWIFVIA